MAPKGNNKTKTKKRKTEEEDYGQRWTTQLGLMKRDYFRVIYGIQTTLKGEFSFFYICTSHVEEEVNMSTDYKCIMTAILLRSDLQFAVCRVDKHETA